MDRASQIAQEAVALAWKNSPTVYPPGESGYKAAFEEMLRKYFPGTKRKAREPRHK